MAHEVQNFQEDVLDASHEIPVLVDFWAPWCGPCRVLGPVLEELASESDGRWKLAKVNTDENPELSMQFGIRGIPAVKMFIDGSVADEFTGALPKYAVEQWLEKALPSKTRSLVEESLESLRLGRTEEARAGLLEAMKEDPGNGTAAVALAQIELFENPEAASEIIAKAEIVDPILLQVGDGIRLMARLLSMKEPYGDLPESPARGEYVAAIEALHDQDFDGALRAFISVIMKDRYYDDDGARKASLVIFNMLGEDDELVRTHRRTFNMALY